MSAESAARLNYLRTTVSTATPQRLVVMLYDRLALDLTRAEQAARAGDRVETSRQVGHAQSIVAELQGSLDRTQWDGADRLAALYSFMLRELALGTVSADADRIHAVLDTVAELRGAWHEAERASAGTARPTTGAWLG